MLYKAVDSCMTNNCVAYIIAEYTVNKLTVMDRRTLQNM
jgi:hypothetical protein